MTKHARHIAALTTAAKKAKTEERRRRIVEKIRVIQIRQSQFNNLAR